jgi:hypothetical protein
LQKAAASKFFKGADYAKKITPKAKKNSNLTVMRAIFMANFIAMG